MWVWPVESSIHDRDHKISLTVACNEDVDQHATNFDFRGLKSRPTLGSSASWQRHGPRLSTREQTSWPMTICVPAASRELSHNSSLKREPQSCSIFDLRGIDFATTPEIRRLVTDRSCGIGARCLSTQFPSQGPAAQAYFFLLVLRRRLQCFRTHDVIQILVSSYFGGWWSWLCWHGHRLCTWLHFLRILQNEKRFTGFFHFQEAWSPNNGKCEGCVSGCAWK